MLKKANHGEVLFFEVESIPGGAKRIIAKDNFYVVGESETHGNDHRITVDEQVELYLTEDDKLFIKSLGNIEVYCPNRTRHATVDLPPGIWEVGHAVEYDYFSEVKRRVRD